MNTFCGIMWAAWCFLVGYLVLNGLYGEEACNRFATKANVVAEWKKPMCLVKTTQGGWVDSDLITFTAEKKP